MKSLLMAALVLAPVTLANLANTEGVEPVELIQESTAAIAGSCLLRDVYLANRLEAEAVVATIEIDRPSILVESPPPALAEVFLPAGETVFVAQTCPNLSCRHNSQILSIELSDIRFFDDPSSWDEGGQNLIAAAEHKGRVDACSEEPTPALLSLLSRGSWKGAS